MYNDFPNALQDLYMFTHKSADLGSNPASIIFKIITFFFTNILVYAFSNKVKTSKQTKVAVLTM